MVLSLQGCMAVGKTTVLNYLRENAPYVNVSNEENSEVVHAFLDEHPDGWVIDGNYKALSYERRCEEADVIIQMLFGRLDCLSRCLRRYRIYKGNNRPDMTEGCDEKIDWEFIRWILWDGRKREKRDLFRLTR